MYISIYIKANVYLFVYVCMYVCLSVCCWAAEAFSLGSVLLGPLLGTGPTMR
jgi:hypothetical protein